MKKKLLRTLLAGVLAFGTLFAVGCQDNESTSGGDSSSGGTATVDKTQDTLVSSFEEFYDCYHIWTRATHRWRAERNRDPQYITHGEFSLKTMRNREATGEDATYYMGVPLKRADGLEHNDFTNVVSYSFDVINPTENEITVASAPAKIQSAYRFQNATMQEETLEAGEKITFVYEINRIELDYGIGLTDLTHLLVQVSGVDPTLYFDNFKVEYDTQDYVRPVLPDAIAPAAGLVAGADLYDSGLGGIADGQDVRAMTFDEKYGSVLKCVFNSSGTGFNRPRVHFKGYKTIGCDYVKFVVKVVAHEGYEDALPEARMSLNMEYGQVTKENDGATYASDLSDWTTITFEAKDNEYSFGEEANAWDLSLTTVNTGTKPFYFDVYVAMVELGYYDLESDGSVMNLTEKYTGISAATIQPTGASAAVEIEDLTKWVPVSGKLTITLSKDEKEDRIIELNVTAAAHEHDWTLRTDETSHWDECPCGEKTNVATHEYDEDGYCACGEENPLTHEHDWQYVVSGEKHWQVCRCGEKQNTAQHDFTSGECVCGRRPQYVSSLGALAGSDLKQYSGAAGQLASGVSKGGDVRSLVEDGTYGTVLKWTSSGGRGMNTPRMQFTISNAKYYDYVRFVVKLVPYEDSVDLAEKVEIYLCRDNLGRITRENDGTTYASDLAEWTTITFDRSNNAAAFEEFDKFGVAFTTYCEGVSTAFNCDVYFALVECGYSDLSLAPSTSTKYSGNTLKAVTNGAAGQLSSGISQGKDVREWVTDETYGTVLKWTSSGNSGMTFPRMQFNFADVSKYDYVSFTLKIVPYSADDEEAAKTKELAISKLGVGVTNDEDGVTYASEVADWTTVTFDKANNAEAFAEFDSNGIVPIIIYCDDGLFNCYVYIAEIEFGYYEQPEIEAIDLTAKYLGLASATFKAEGAAEATEITDLTAWTPVAGELTITVISGGESKVYVLTVTV